MISIKHVALVVCISSSTSMYVIAQNSFPPTGNVAIGTNSPDQPLTINAPSGNNSLVSFKQNAVTNAYVGLGMDGVFRNQTLSNIQLQLRADGASNFISLYTNGAEKFRLDASGNIGVGTISPNDKMEVAGNIRIHTGSTDGGRLVWHGGTDGTQEYRARVAPDGHLAFFPGESIPTTLALTQNGNVGIGTTTPGTPLEVRKDQNSDTRIMVRNYGSGANAQSRYDLSTVTANSYAIMSLNDNSGSPYYQFSMGSAVTTAYFDAPAFYWRNSSGSPYMRIAASGNVGIGTISVSDVNYKLFVATGIRTRKVRVDQDTWSDYVFDKDYRLPPLEEVEQYIQKHKHLPDIPSEEEVKKEGLNLGDNQAVLLKKIEELTLYIIEQNKVTQQLIAENKLLKKEITEIKKVIQK